MDGSTRTPERSAWYALGAAALAGLAGALPRVEGAPDPLALLAWLTFLAPAAGALCGAFGVRLWPLGLLVPGLWMVLLVEVDLFSERDVRGAVAPGLVVAGLYLLGLGLGALAPRRPAALAGALLLAGPLLSALAVAGGLLAGEGGFAAAHPAAQAVLLSASPAWPVFDAAGWDWVHENPAIYRLGGVEWVPRRPLDGGLAGAVSCVVGCASAMLLPRLTRR
ncbi:MAG: hypothetical protein AAF682_21535 [Planctomycetota bacterium]